MPVLGKYRFLWFGLLIDTRKLVNQLIVALFQCRCITREAQTLCSISLEAGYNLYSTYVMTAQ